MIPQWLVFSLISILGYVSAELAQRTSMKRIEDISAEANNFIVWLIISFVGLTGSLLTGQLNIELVTFELIVIFILIGCIYFWGGTLFYSSYKGISATVGSTLVSFSVIISTILGIVFINESLDLYKFIGILFILSAIFILNYGKDFKINKYAVLALSGATLYGVAFTVDKILVLKIGPFFYLFLFALSIALISLFFRSRVIINDLTKKARRDNFKIMFLSGLSFSVFNLATFNAYNNGGDVGIIDAMNNSSVIFIFIVEYLIFKERNNLRKKILAMVLAVIGVILLVNR